MNLGQRIRHGTKWLILGSLSGQAISFAAGIVLARLLLPEDFGLLVTVQIFTGFVGMIASGGMGEATVQAAHVSERDYQTVFTVQLAMGVVIYLAFFLIAPRFARYFDQPIYQELLRVSALSFLIRPFSNNPQVRLRRAMRFKETSLIGFASLLFTSAVSIGLAASGFGVWSLVWSGLAGAVFSAVLLSTRSPWRPKLCYDRDSAARLGSYGAKNVLNELLVYFRTQVPNLFVTKLLGPHHVGLFNKADSLFRMPLRVTGGSTYQTVFRAMSHTQSELDRSRYLYFRTLTLLGFYTFPLYVALAFAAEPFVVGLYGHNWRDAAGPLIILSLAAPFQVLELASGAVMAAQDRLGRESILQALSLAVLAAACFAATPFGIAAIAAAVTAAAGLHGLLLTQLALSALDSRWRDVLHALSPSLRLCAAEAAVVGATLVGMDHADLHNPLLRLTILTACGLGAYAALSFLRPPAPLVAEMDRWRRVLRSTPVTP